jgi:predicted kinase
MRAIITVGIPGSGKSWKYKDFKGVNVNRDDIRAELFPTPYKVSKSKERQVTQLQTERIRLAAWQGQDLVVSDTGLNPAYRKSLTKALEDLGYTVELDVIECSYELAVKRDLSRARSVGPDVIWKFYKRWHKQFGIQPYEAKPGFPAGKAVYICDIDGTIATMKDRSPFDWHRVGEDEVYTPTYRILLMASQFADIIFMSGRDEVCRPETEAWLRNLGIRRFELYMRPEGSQEKDFKVKLDLFHKHIKGRQVMGVFDDRPQVCRLWNLLDLPLFKVGDQGEF